MIPVSGDEHTDAAPAINAAVPGKGRVELGPGTHWTFAPVGLDVAVDTSADLTLTGQNIRGTKLVSNLRDATTNNQGQHDVLSFRTTSGNMRYLHLSDMDVRHGANGLFTERVLYSRLERMTFMQSWKWGAYLYKSSIHMDGMSFVHNVYGNSLSVQGAPEKLGSHLVNSVIGEDSGAIYVNSNGRLRISGCELFKLRDNLNPDGPHGKDYGNPAFYVGSSSILTVDGNHIQAPKDVCQNIFLLDKIAGLNVLNNPVLHVGDRVLLRARFLHVGEYPYAPIIVEGNTIHFGPNGLIQKANQPSHAMRNSRIRNNVLMVPEGMTAKFEAQLQAIRDIPPGSGGNGIPTKPNIVEGNTIFEYTWTAPT